MNVSFGTPQSTSVHVQLCIATNVHLCMHTHAQVVTCACTPMHMHTDMHAASSIIFNKLEASRQAKPGKEWVQMCTQMCIFMGAFIVVLILPTSQK